MPSKPSPKTCLVLGCGPSLADIPNEFLDKYPTFGGNRIYLKYTPTYYVSVDELNMLNCVDEINGLSSVKYISSRWAHKIKDSIPLTRQPTREFSYEPLVWINEGWSVTFVMLQLAYWHGFERVGLLGIDHRYTLPGKPGERYRGIEHDHFTPGYYRGEVNLIVPDLSKTERSYRLAEDAYKKAGRRVVNLTHNTALDIFDKEDWQTW
jgi:hypothetical protein